MHHDSAGIDRRRLLALAGLLGAGQIAPERLLAWAGRQSRAQADLAVLDPQQFRTLDALSELILPETDTPGARAAGVAAFADGLLDAWFADAAKQSFLADLDAFDAACRRRFDVAFADADAEQQTACAREAEEAAARDRKGFAAHPERLADAQFFDVAKWLTLFGYFTSEVGMRQELGWRAVPGRWDGCRDVQKR